MNKVFKKLNNFRHLFYAWWGSVKFHQPSDELLVIGITGTAGKSSVIHFLRQVLEFAGFKVGSLSTVDFYINGQLTLNDKKMTMVGKYFIQEKLREMVKAGCNVAIVETTSEGFLQHRHQFINYDTIVLTNLYPEHIEAHGGFENYKKAKLGIFEYVAKCKTKSLKSKVVSHKTTKTCVVNLNNIYFNEFLKFNFENKFGFGVIDEGNQQSLTTYSLDLITCLTQNIRVTANGLNFVLNDKQYFAPLYGAHNIENLLCVIAIAKSININEEKIRQAISQIKSPPGRIEFINEAEKLDFQVIVDYAFEPVALQKLFGVVELLQPKHVIHVCGSTGGGRDKARREPIGKLVGEKADIFIITDEDPYNEDPLEIMETVKVGALKSGKIEGRDLFMILNREEAIKKAIELARPGDLVLISGKGSEQKMCVAGGKMIDWDDRMIVRKFIKSKSL